MKLSTLHYQRDIVTLYGPGFPDEGDQWQVDLTDWDCICALYYAASIRHNASASEVEVDIDLSELMRDMRSMIADSCSLSYYSLIMDAVLVEETSIAQLYHGNVYDIPLYLTLHAMVLRGDIDGLSPYDMRAKGLNHNGLIYYYDDYEPCPF